MGQVSIATAYIWSAVVFVILFLITVIIANAIPYKPNNNGATSRRIWFWIFAVLTFAISFLINIWVAHGIRIASDHEAYVNNSIIGAGAAFVLFVVVGLVISKMFSRTKAGTWF